MISFTSEDARGSGQYSVGKQLAIFLGPFSRFRAERRAP
jgi:hypothetical protein